MMFASDRTHLFGQVLSLAQGSSFLGPRVNIPFFGSVAHELGNLELYCQVSASFPSVCSARSLEQLDLGFTNGLATIASQFGVFPPDFFDKFTTDTLYSIFSDPAFSTSTEDALLDFLLSRFHHDPDSLCLFEFVHFEYLSPSSLTSFAESAPFSTLGPAVWANLVRAILSRGPRTVSCPFVLDPLDGLLSYFKRLRGNVREAVTVTGHAPVKDGPGPWSPENAADFTSPSVFCSLSEPGQWLAYDFPDRLVTPTHYTLRGGENEWSGNLTNWVLEGSDADGNWVELDRRIECWDITPTPLVFTVTNPIPCRQIRIRQIEFHPSHNNNIILSAFELFGKAEQKTNRGRRNGTQSAH
jgi:hypothetical protein